MNSKQRKTCFIFQDFQFQHPSNNYNILSKLFNIESFNLVHTSEGNGSAFSASINKYMQVGNKRIIITLHTEINFDSKHSITYVKEMSNLHPHTNTLISDPLGVVKI